MCLLLFLDQSTIWTSQHPPTPPATLQNHMRWVASAVSDSLGAVVHPDCFSDVLGRPMGIRVYEIALMCACRAASLLKGQKEDENIHHMSQFQWTKPLELHCMFNHLN